MSRRSPSFRVLPAAALLLSLAAATAAAAPAKPTPAPAPAPAATTKAGGDQTNGLDMTGGQGSGTPIEIYADQGLELSQDAKTVTGRVNAKAIRGHVTLTADVLIAHYRDKGMTPPDSASLKGKPPPPPPKAVKSEEKSDTGDSGNGSEIWRVEAIGHVTIATPTQTAYGDRADYNIDDAVVVLTGKNLRMVTPTDTITARDSLEYWDQRQQAVARGDGVAVRAEKRLQGDILVADFAENAQKQMTIQRSHAYDHVILTTPSEVVTGDRGDYNVETGIVTVTGSVKMTKDKNQLDGQYAVVNLNTGVDRVFPNIPGGEVPVGQPQVKGLLVPQKKTEKPSAASGATAAGR